MYIKSDLKLSVYLLALLSGVKERDSRLHVRPSLSFRPLQKEDLFKITASLGLVKVFKQLKLYDEIHFQEKLEDISKYAIDGNNLEIIRICEQEDSQFSHIRPLFYDYNIVFNTAFSIAYRNSTMNILCWLLEIFPSSAETYRFANQILESGYYDGPITVSKTRFLLNVLHRSVDNDPMEMSIPYFLRGLRISTNVS
jgi:hypothetical protein